jgi:iron complex outermembrane receptor protein
MTPPTSGAARRSRSFRLILLQAEVFMKRVIAICAAAELLGPTPGLAQRSQENALASAVDGFGTTVGNERVGVYSTTSVRGFSPITAGNRRIEGLYFDLGGNGLTNRLIARSTVRVGLPALTYPFPAPSGIVDYELRRPTGPAVLSAVASIPAYGGLTLELDGHAPVTGGFTIGAGAGIASNLYVDGRRTEARSFAILPQLDLGRGDLFGFFGVSQTGGSVPPIMITSGPVLPPLIDTHRFKSQKWIDNDQLSFTYGAVATALVSSSLKLRLGAFESRSTRRRTFTDLFTDIRPDGSAIERVVSDPRLPARWTSGEARLIWDRKMGVLNSELVFSLRGREKRLESGGSATALLGSARLGVLTPYPEPDFTYRTPTVNHVRQGSIGLDWIGHIAGGVDFNVGVQRVVYRSIFTVDGAASTSRARPWLYNATVAYAPTSWLGLFVGTSRGLEESAPAPPSAKNRDDPVPAARTKQVDGGVRVAFGGMRLVVGAFQIERPYFSVGPDKIYRALGSSRNRGIEISLAGNLTDRLFLVSGLVLLDPQVIGEAVDEGRAGKRPVGSTTRIARLDAEYSLDKGRGISLLFGVQHSGPIVASTSGFSALGGKQLMVAPGVTLDAGARAKFLIGKIPASVRAQVLNLTDERRFAVSSSNAFIAPERRRFTVQLTADF